MNNNNGIKNDKKMVKATGFIKREDGHAEVCVNGQWLLTSKIENYFLSGGKFECVTQNTIYSNIA